MLLGFVSAISFLRYEINPPKVTVECIYKPGVSPLSSSIIADGISEVDEEFHNASTVLSTHTVSLFLLGFAVSATLEFEYCVLTIHSLNHYSCPH
jgi:hypothetical protein